MALKNKMIKTFSLAILAYTAAAAEAPNVPMESSDWFLPDIEFTAIEQDYFNKYWLKGRYGPNNRGFFGQFAYIFLEVGGAEIKDNAVVSTWATITRPDEFVTEVDIFTGEETITPVETGVAYTQTETVECKIRYRDDPCKDATPEYPCNTKIYKSSINNFRGGGNIKTEQYSASSSYAEVISFDGKILDSGENQILEKNKIWKVPLKTDSRYPVGHSKNNWDATSWAGCYMQRRSNKDDAVFWLKNAIEYEVSVGYGIYEGNYDLNFDNHTTRRGKKPTYSGKSEKMKFFWWDIDGAAGMVTTTVAALALLNLF